LAYSTNGMFIPINMTETSNIKEKQKHGITLSHNKKTVRIILTLSLILTVSATLISIYYSRKIVEERFDFRTREISKAIENKLKLYEQALWGGVALINCFDDVTRKDFQDYVYSLKIEKNLKGIQGIGYSIPLNENNKDSLVIAIQKEGFADFSIRPERKRDSYSSIIFLDPFDWRNKRAFRYDMWSNDMRRSAMKKSMES
jgi:CHASE1-domain containing sensor protein